MPTTITSGGRRWPPGWPIRVTPWCAGQSSTACGNITSARDWSTRPTILAAWRATDAPELLEWLAGWFIEHGHSLKGLHRLLLKSAVYRQSSADHTEYRALDAGNMLLWRMNRTRLDAESIRDAMLYVSGRLDLTMGGPSVQQFFFKDDHSPVYDYARFDVDDPRGLRRSVYRFLVRSVPDPFMECLDCADPSILTPKRNTTLTAIQALALLNNPFCVRQAEHLAERLRTIDQHAPQQIVAAYRLPWAAGRASAKCRRWSNTPVSLVWRRPAG